MLRSTLYSGYMYKQPYSCIMSVHDYNEQVVKEARVTQILQARNDETCPSVYMFVLLVDE